MRIRMLGRLEVLADAGTVLDLGTPKQRTVCAMLLTHANHLVTLEQLIDELWPENPPQSAVANTRTYAANLRRLFRTAAAPRLDLEPRGNGYALHLKSDEFDMLVFQDLLRLGRDEVSRGDLIAAEECLDRAAVLWRGQPFEDVPVGPVLAARRTLLAQEYAAAVEDRAEVLLRLGRDRIAIPLLREHVHAHRTRERGWELLMSALQRSGDVAGALSAYTEARTALVELLGVEPGLRLRRLQQVLLQRETGRPNVPSTRPVPAPTERRQDPVPRCLPRPIRDFTGREEPVAQLVTELSEGHPVLIAIDGMAGSGKTTLAVHVATRVADRYPDGQLYIDLHGHSESTPVEPATALSLLLGQLGLPAAQLPTGLAERSARWRTEVAQRRALILLDNAADSRQVAPLLPGASQSAVLVTSRRLLIGLHDTRHISLDVLLQQEAVHLLARIVGEGRVAPDPEAAAAVARKCGYLPLALRIAGARLTSRPSWTVGDLAKRLHNAEPPLVDLTVEGSSVAAAFALSYRHLPAAAQRMFRLVGSHPGIDLDEHAAAALADLPSAAARDLLEDLVDVHLLEQPTIGRYRLHDLICDYAQSLDPVEDNDSAFSRLVGYYIHSIVNASRWLIRGLTLERLDWGAAPSRARRFADQDSALPWFDAEWRNALAVAQRALDLGWHRHACLLSLAMWPSMNRRSYNEQIAVIMEWIVQSRAKLNDRYLLGMTHHYLAGSYTRLMKHSRSIHHLEQALVVWRETGDRWSESSALGNYSVLLMSFGRFREAIERGAQAIDVAQESGHGGALALAHLALGSVYRILGDGDMAMRHLRYAAAKCRSMAAMSNYHHCLVELGQAHGILGHLIVAGALLSRAEAMKRAAGNLHGAAEVLSERGEVYLRAGHVEQALACQQRALDDIPTGVDPQIEALLHNNLSRTMCAIGDLPRALEHGRTALRITENASFPYERARAHARIAAALVDDPTAAATHWEQALAMHTEMGTPERHEAAEQLKKLRTTPQPYPRSATGAAVPRP